MSETPRIGDILVKRGKLDRATADAIGAERTRGQTRYASTAVKLGKVSETDAVAALAEQCGMPGVDLTRAVVPKQTILRIPLEIACQQLVLPLRLEGSNLLLAMANPRDWKVVDEIGFATGLLVLPHVALQHRLIELIPQAHATTGDVWIAPGGTQAVADEHGYLPIVQGPKAPPLPAGVEVEVEVEVDEPLDLEPQRTVVKGSSKVILVVEDDPSIAELVVNALTPLGHEIISASRGLEALKLIKARRPDLIVLDAMLPEVHGFEICRKVKDSKRFADTPVLMLSAIYRGWRIAADIKATYKVDEFLEKPFRVADLRRRAEQLLEKRQPVAELLGPTAQERLANAMKAIQMNDWETAFQELRQAESLEPFSAKIQYLLGQSLEKRDRIFQAIYHYERAVELEPKLFAATRTLAMLYQAKGFRHKAVEMWERSLAAAPNAEVRAQIKGYLVSLL